MVYGTQGIVRPKRFRGEPIVDQIGVMVVFGPLLDIFLHLGGLKKAVLKEGSPWGLYLGEGRESLPRCAAGPILGAPQAAMAIEKLFTMGVRELIVAGCCGSIDEGLRIGDIILPNCALSEEGTSRAYSPELVFLPDDGLYQRLETMLVSRGIGYKKGPVFSTDAVYMETTEKVHAYQRLGIMGVDMEISSLFCVGGLRGVRVAGAFVVSDEVREDRWVPGFNLEAFRKGCGDLARALYEGVFGDGGI